MKRSPSSSRHDRPGRQPERASEASAHAAASAAAPVDVPHGLVWVTDSTPGITRVRHGQTFSYVDADGQAVTDETTLARIRKLAIPPAYESVWICANPKGHLQATGRDARGRKQYRYHVIWQAERGADKFASLRAFGRALPRIRARVQRDLGTAKKAAPTRTRVLATLVRLLDTTFIRIGNEEYARGNGSYGLTTLRNRHADVRAAELRLSFKGKSGVRHEVKLDDARVAAVVRQCRQLPGQELFQYVDEAGEIHRINSTDVNDYLAEVAGRKDGLHVTAKDFRTWHGSVLALEFTRLACSGPLERGAAKEVLVGVSRRLGNTVAVCKKAYVHPRVLDLGQALGNEELRSELLRQAPWEVSGSSSARGLSAAERRLMALLTHEAPALEDMMKRSIVVLAERKTAVRPSDRAVRRSASSKADAAPEATRRRHAPVVAGSHASQGRTSASAAAAAQA